MPHMSAPVIGKLYVKGSLDARNFLPTILPVSN